MKKIIFFLTLIISSYFLQSCIDDNEKYNFEENASLSISTEINEGSRAVIESNSFDEGSRIGLIVPDYTNKIVEARSYQNRWIISNTIKLKQDWYKIYSFYPYSNGTNCSKDESGNLNIPVNIRSNIFDGIDGQADFLWGQTEANQENPKAHIEFKHVLTRLSFELKLADSDSGKGILNSICLQNTDNNKFISSEGTLNVYTGIASPSFDKIPYVLLDTLNYQLSKETSKIDMLVFPIDLQADSLVQLSVTIDSTEYMVPLKKAKWEAGKHYVYPITINRANSEIDNSYEYDGQEVVDLGLSVKWCSHNVGAKSPEEKGEYYTWGGLQPKYGSYSSFCTEYVDNIKNTDFDIAHIEMGKEWCMPTKVEWKELIEKCTWVFSRKLNGYIVVGKNGNKIFLPISGSKDLGGGNWYYTYYWTSNGVDEKTCTAVNINEHFDEYDDNKNIDASIIDGCDKRYGYVIRPVCQ